MISSPFPYERSELAKLEETCRRRSAARHVFILMGTSRFKTILILNLQPFSVNMSNFKLSVICLTDCGFGKPMPPFLQQCFLSVLYDLLIAHINSLHTNTALPQQKDPADKELSL